MKQPTRKNVFTVRFELRRHTLPITCVKLRNVSYSWRQYSLTLQFHGIVSECNVYERTYGRVISTFRSLGRRGVAREYYVSNVNKNPTDATVCRYLFIAKLLYMFRVSQHPSSGVLKTLPAACGIGHTTGTTTTLQRGLIGTMHGTTSLKKKYIQGVPGGTDQTSGGCSLCYTIPM